MPATLVVQPKPLAKNRQLNAEFDKALKRINKPVVVKPKRARGRPRVGRVVFTQKQVNQLPEYAKLASVSRALSVRYTSIQQWCVCGKKPLPFIEQDGHKWFRKDVLISWLKATKRFKVKK